MREPLLWALIFALVLFSGLQLQVIPTPQIRAQVAAPVAVPVPEASAQVQEARVIASFEAHVTAYNSLPSQTDSTPWQTASMTTTREGIVAVSRDFLQGAGVPQVPYGSVLRLKQVIHTHGCGAGVLGHLVSPGDLFLVEDTMHRRKRRQVDIWMRYYDEAQTWGTCRAVFELLPPGSAGPT